MSAETSTDTTAGGSVISLPQGGGAVTGLGEKFSPDLFTGTGNFSVPIQVPAGRRGLGPQLSLGYSTGNGNGPFGLGWALSVPGVSRKTSHGVPRYQDVLSAGGEPADVFLLSGAEDLVPVATSGEGRVRYRPRTEGLFARIEHVTGDEGDFWEVRTRDGLTTLYGTPGSVAGQDPAVVADPGGPARVFGWRITRTTDLLGNQIRYEYQADSGDQPPHRWNHPLLHRISYADYGDPAAPSFLVTLDFEYETRPDAFSDYRAGFEVRTTQRCHRIRVTTHAFDGVARVAREYRLTYVQAPFTGVSLLARVDVVGVDETAPADAREQALPPLTFEYSGFDPTGRRFEQVTGAGLPTGSLADPTLTLVDLQGCGLPDILELGPHVRRYWRNAGGGRFDLPRSLSEAPAVSLADPGVQVLDADGDGRPDLMVATAGLNGGSGSLAGYYPMTLPAGWSARTFQRYRRAPSVGPGNPGTRLVDLTGDGLTDVLHSGTRLLAFFNDRDPARAWSEVVAGNGSGPQVDLSDPRIRTADMTGDGLQDLVLLRNGNVVYWPNLGYGHWGDPVHMRGAPRLPDGFDPHRVLLADVDGDGLADLLLVEDGQVRLWGNRSGNEFTTEPVIVRGTPSVVDTDAIQPADLHGTGMAGLLYTRPTDASAGSGWRFLDLTGGVKPYLLTGMDNHLGAATTITYTPSAAEYLRDRADPATRWKTTLPFPVQVVSRVEIQDTHSGGRLVTEYRYHHGYWDGVEREFRGFACVDRTDAETFDPTAVDPGDGPPEHHSPPTLTRSWFHPGPVAAAEAGDWIELDLSGEYWPGDPAMLARPASATALLAGLDRAGRRDALRALRGHLLRSELYALDGADVADRPYAVTESVFAVRTETGWPGLPEGDRLPAIQPIFFPFRAGTRTTQWERGDEPMTRFTMSAEPDGYGLPLGQVDVAVPRLRDPRTVAAPGDLLQAYLATYTANEYAQCDEPGGYLVDRKARTTGFEVINDGRSSATELADSVLTGSAVSKTLRVIGQAHTFYDGDAFNGLPLGELGDHGLVTREETLAFPDEFLDELFAAGDPQRVSPRPPYLVSGPPAWTGEYPAEFQALLPECAGYVHHADSDVSGSEAGYWIQTARHRYDVHPDPGHPNRVPRGLLVESLDPLGASTGIAYDPHDLFPVTATDAAGLTTIAGYDLRVAQPRQVTDVNGNTSAVTYTPLGLVGAHYVRGKAGAGEGDQTLPGTTIAYDLLAFAQGRGPASVTTVRRMHHDTDTDVPADERDEVLRSVQFSDGFDRILQTRAQAEDVLFGDPTFGGGVIPADQSAQVGETVGRSRPAGSADNVVVSGWQIYDNKGRVVQKYEPFYSTDYTYAPPQDTQLGQKAVLFYDPRGQLIRTLNPDASQTLVVLGVPTALDTPEAFRPTPWETYTYDPNDNAGRTHLTEAAGYADHWNTPASIEIDALGRTVTATARNGITHTDQITTRTGYDIQSNITTITDALGRVAFRYRFDLLKRRWRIDSIDAGRRDTVIDAAGRAVEARDEKGALTLSTFDRLKRPTHVWARDRSDGDVTLRQRIGYGDAGDPDQDPAARQAARALNLLGRPVRAHDEAGLVISGGADFKGNPLSTTRQVIADAAIIATYTDAAAHNWQVAPITINWASAPGQTQDQRDAELLDPTRYTHDTTYDALDRVTRHTLPADVTGHRGVLKPTYNRAGALDAVALDDTTYVQRICYDAKGQRALIAYGNGVMTRYTYDPRTFRLARLRSEPYSLDVITYRPTGAVLQDLSYGYDLGGNILTIHDRTPGCGVSPTLDALDRTFTYDPIYRLLTADGREQQTPVGGDPWTDIPRGVDPTRTQRYTETYTYDQVGNLLELAHQPAAAHLTSGYTRTYTVEAGSNRLERMTVGTTPYDCTFDPNGNLTGETMSRHFAWNHADRLATFATQTPGAEPSVHAHYLYDAAGRRVVKLVRRQGGLIETTRYLAGFEHHRWEGGANNHTHVMDDKQRIALVRNGPAHPDDGGPATAYELPDHLGSAVATLDATGTLTNREEYTPYGEASFGSYILKRYRYTGCERDEESGLNYHAARYYSPWLTRWTACDPLGPVETSNVYRYCLSSPVSSVDTRGTDSSSSQSRSTGVLDNPVCEKNEPVATFDPQNLDPILQTELTHAGELNRHDRGLNASGNAMPSSKESPAIEDDLNHPSRRAARNLKTMATVGVGLIPGKPGLVIRSGLALYSMLTAKDASEVAGPILVGMMLGGIVAGANRSSVSLKSLEKGESLRPSRIHFEPDNVDQATHAVKLSERQLEGALRRLHPDDRSVLGDALQNQGHETIGKRSSTPGWVPGEQEKELAGLRQGLEDFERTGSTHEHVVDLLSDEVRAALLRLREARELLGRLIEAGQAHARLGRLYHW